MFERLGLFTIIIFGELALGVINGVRKIETVRVMDWINFGLGFSVVFALWWIFFTFISNRAVKKGFDTASILELLYIPALISLGCVAVSMSSFFVESEYLAELRQLFGFAVAIFLFCIVMLMFLLVYPPVFDTLKRPMLWSLVLTGIVFLAFSFTRFNMSATSYFIWVMVILILEISYLNYLYYTKLLKAGIDPSEVAAAQEEE